MPPWICSALLPASTTRGWRPSAGTTRSCNSSRRMTARSMSASPMRTISSGSIAAASRRRRCPTSSATSRRASRATRIRRSPSSSFTMAAGCAPRRFALPRACGSGCGNGWMPSIAPRPFPNSCCPCSRRFPSFPTGRPFSMRQTASWPPTMPSGSSMACPQTGRWSAARSTTSSPGAGAAIHRRGPGEPPFAMACAMTARPSRSSCLASAG